MPAPLLSATGGKSVPFSLIAADVAITGDIDASVDLHIDGRVTGDIRCAGLVLGRDARVKGHITAKSARVAGEVEGSITADELIVEASARIAGDVSYETVSIQPGGQVAGRFAHQGTAGAGMTGADLKLVGGD